MGKKTKQTKTTTTQNAVIAFSSVETRNSKIIIGVFD